MPPFKTEDTGKFTYAAHIYGLYNISVGQMGLGNDKVGSPRFPVSSPFRTKKLRAKSEKWETLVLDQALTLTMPVSPVPQNLDLWFEVT